MSIIREDLAEGITVYCGDCREILPSLGRVDAVVTDPPYGMDFNTGVEIEQKYFAIARRRIEEALRQPDLFIERSVSPKQEAMLILAEYGRDRLDPIYAGDVLVSLSLVRLLESEHV